MRDAEILRSDIVAQVPQEMTNSILKKWARSSAPQIGARRQTIPCPRGNKRWKNCKKQAKITPCSFLLCLFLKLVGWWMISNFRGNAENFPLAKVTIKHGEIATRSRESTLIHTRTSYSTPFRSLYLRSSLLSFPSYSRAGVANRFFFKEEKKGIIYLVLRK